MTGLRSHVSHRTSRAGRSWSGSTTALTPSRNIATGHIGLDIRGRLVDIDRGVPIHQADEARIDRRVGLAIGHIVQRYCGFGLRLAEVPRWICANRAEGGVR